MTREPHETRGGLPSAKILENLFQALLAMDARRGGERRGVGGSEFTVAIGADNTCELITGPESEEEEEGKEVYTVEYFHP